MPVMGRLSLMAPVEPRKGTPKLNTPPSDATSQ
jgi:hypothetical protein